MAEERVERELAAIFAGDIAGCGQLTGSNQTLGLAESRCRSAFDGGPGGDADE